MGAIIFDFNGTLYRDTELHERAWQQFIQELIGRKFTDEEFHQIHGRTNHLVLEDVLGRSLTAEEGNELSERKEAIYREEVIKEDKVELISGAEAFFNFLKEKKVPLNIATASPKVNVDFYFEQFQLDRWFDYQKIVYNNGTLASKPAPDYYVQAAKNVGALPKEMIVFEDSLIGLQSAYNAQSKQIVGVSTNGNHQFLEETGLADLVIDDYTDSRIRDLCT